MLGARELSARIEFSIPFSRFDWTASRVDQFGLDIEQPFVPVYLSRLMKDATA
jgi:hypothetical protein